MGLITKHFVAGTKTTYVDETGPAAVRHGAFFTFVGVVIILGLIWFDRWLSEED